MKSRTSTTAAWGSSTRKYTTAFTLTGTLSRVITSWGGTSRVIVRRSTFTILSTMGMMRNSPGPFAPTRRPRRKMTPRSYSRTTLIALIRNSTITAMIIPSAMFMIPPLSLPVRRALLRARQRG